MDWYFAGQCLGAVFIWLGIGRAFDNKSKLNARISAILPPYGLIYFFVTKDFQRWEKVKIFFGRRRIRLLTGYSILSLTVLLTALVFRDGIVTGVVGIALWTLLQAFLINEKKPNFAELKISDRTKED